MCPLLRIFYYTHRHSWLYCIVYTNGFAFVKLLALILPLSVFSLTVNDSHMNHYVSNTETPDIRRDLWVHPLLPQLTMSMWFVAFVSLLAFRDADEFIVPQWYQRFFFSVSICRFAVDAGFLCGNPYKMHYLSSTGKLVIRSQLKMKV